MNSPHPMSGRADVVPDGPAPVETKIAREPFSVELPDRESVRTVNELIGRIGPAAYAGKRAKSLSAALSLSTQTRSIYGGLRSAWR